ncbi:hydroxymethylglutaryl-CoA lyase [Yoonia litorea]|uniref:Hydroxymethylglutaryl-CoA lyase n=1 Tax=Yoonia litorea TaxID=1123755 RepID=A0A1I6LTH0_9RHOB|nr:hydroxymethylglutaryl-CoA lyase [Yoonia litorea]SFS06572.1 hydroxymethylglutaryl-CoA lyase [Yoonia litorea]
MSGAAPEFVRIHEVGPRDGLQNEPRVIPLGEKLALIDLLARSGLHEIEVGSFVHPKRVPQMAESDALLQALPVADVRYAVLVPNMRGWDRFVAARQDGVAYSVAVFISASEGFSQSNLGCTINQSIDLLRPVAEAAGAAGVHLRGYVSCVTDCPFDGPVSPDQVADVVGRLREVAAMPVSLGDTIGKGTPGRVARMIEAVRAVVPVDDLAGHFHDTAGQALGNIEAALDLGLRAFDAAVGGLGGCPYAPGAPGNVATEAVLDLMAERGFETGVDRDLIGQAAEMARAMR